MNDEWGYIPLKDLLLLCDSGTWGNPSDSTDGVIVLRSTNINNWKLDLAGDIAYRKVSEKDLKNKRLQVGDIFVTKSSGSPQLIGEAALFDIENDRPYLFSNFTQRLRPNVKKILPKYLHYYLSSPIGREVINEMHRTTSGLRNLIVSKYLDQNVPVPDPKNPDNSLLIQERIILRLEQYLDELTEARRLHEKIVVDTNRLMEAVLKETFADLTSQHPTEDLNDDRICLVIPGQHVMAEDYSNTPGSGLPYITGPEDFRDIYPVISKWTEERKVIAHPGDVLFTVKGSGVGKVNLMIDTDCVIGRQVMAIRPNREMLLDEYLFYALLGRYQEFQSMRQGAAIPGIRKEHVRAIKLPLPPTDTQASIITRLGEYKKAIQQMVEDQTRTKVLLNQMEQSILAQAFRGEL